MDMSKRKNYLKLPTIFNIAEMEENIGKAKNQTNNTSKNINSIKGISSCYQCQKNNIRYDEFRDEIYCYSCGLVLRQGLNDYTPSNGSYSHTNKSKLKKKISQSILMK